MDVYNPVYPGLYYFDTFTFTTLGTSGHRGPESTKTYANAPWSADQFSIVDGQQQWTVPATGTYRVTAAGAYGATPGRVVSGDVNLNEGQVVSLLVGQMPTPLTANVVDATTVGGGGGTFISTDQQLLMVASGGDGTGGSAASFSPYGDGNGKNGGGYLSNGLATNATFKFLRPAAYIDGGFGTIFPTGVVPEEGGFGGGQAPVTSGISGGGGYTGSPGDGVSGATCYADPTVRNFTDLGASGNTAGTVTLSIIDPVPLKQTWTWDQKFTNTSPIAATLLISWSDKLGIFQSLTATSADGINWNGVPINEYDTGVFDSPFPFYIAYSDTLNLYIGLKLITGVPIYVISNDGINWVETTPTGGLVVYNIALNANGSSILWAPELGLFVFLAFTQVFSSTDGIFWTLRYDDPDIEMTCITYSPSLHTFVCTCTTPSNPELSYAGVYSTDGVTWNTWSVEGLLPSIGRSVTWSPKLSIFVASINFVLLEDDYVYYSNIAHSTDGQTWSVAGFNVSKEIGIFWNVLWGEGLDIFTAIPSNAPEVNLYSYDGITWSGTTTSVYGTIAYSPTLKIFAVAEESETGRRFISIDGIYYVDLQEPYPGNIEDCTWSSQLGKFATYGFTTSDCIHWSIQNDTFPGRYVWSPELGLFVVFEQESGNFYYSYSYDAITWVRIGLDPLNNVQPVVAWSPTLGVFSGSYYSRDGKNWTNPMDFNAVGWSSFHNMFMAFLNTDAYYSYDGIIWNLGNNDTGMEINSQSVPIVCSSSGRCILAGVYLQDTVILYSDDGINWSHVDIAPVYPGEITWVEELSTFVVQDLEASAIRGYMSTDGINWSLIPDNIQPIGWSPDLARFLCTGGYSQVTKTV